MLPRYIQSKVEVSKYLNVLKRSLGEEDKGCDESTTKAEEITTAAPVKAKAEPLSKPKEAVAPDKPTDKKVPVVKRANNGGGVVPKSKPNAQPNNNKLKPVKVAPTKSMASKTSPKEIPKIVEPDVAPIEVNSNDVNDAKSSILEGENWNVTVTSAHELETLSDVPPKAVTITPKTKAVEAKKAIAVKQQVGLLFQIET